MKLIIPECKRIKVDERFNHTIFRYGWIRGIKAAWQQALEQDIMSVEDYKRLTNNLYIRETKRTASYVRAVTGLDKCVMFDPKNMEFIFYDIDPWEVWGEQEIGWDDNGYLLMIPDKA